MDEKDTRMSSMLDCFRTRVTSPPTPALATVTSPPTPLRSIATVRVLSNPTGGVAGGKTRVWTHIGNTYLALEAGNSGIPEDLMKRVEGAVAKARAYIATNAAALGGVSGRVQVDFSAIAIKYQDTAGNWKTIGREKVVDPELVALMEEIQEVAKEHVAFCNTTEPGILSNRTSTGSAPLDKTTKGWIAASTRSASEFLKTDDYKKYLQSAPDVPAGADARIEAAEAFITRFKTGLETRRTTAQRELRELEAQSPANYKVIGAKKRTIKHLSELIEQCDPQRLDRMAIFWNVAYADLALTGGEPLPQQLTKTNQIRNGMMNYLTKHLTSILPSWLKSVPQQTAMLAYANDVADLNIHGRWDYEDRLEGDGHRTKKKQCVEEGIVNIMKQLRASSWDQKDVFSSFAIPDGENEAQTLVYGAVMDAKTVALTVLPSLPPPPVPSLPLSSTPLTASRAAPASASSSTASRAASASSAVVSATSSAVVSTASYAAALAFCVLATHVLSFLIPSV